MTRYPRKNEFCLIFVLVIKFFHMKFINSNESIGIIWYYYGMVLFEFSLSLRFMVRTVRRES